MIADKENFIKYISKINKIYDDNLPCIRCGSQVLGYIWESSDGAYEDYHEFCTNLECEYERWVDGGDA